MYTPVDAEGFVQPFCSTACALKEHSASATLKRQRQDEHGHDALCLALVISVEDSPPSPVASVGESPPISCDDQQESDLAIALSMSTQSSASDEEPRSTLALSAASEDSDLAAALRLSTLSSASEDEARAASEQDAVDQAIAAVSASYSVDHTNPLFVAPSQPSSAPSLHAGCSSARSPTPGNPDAQQELIWAISASLQAMSPTETDSVLPASRGIMPPAEPHPPPLPVRSSVRQGRGTNPSRSKWQVSDAADRMRIDEHLADDLLQLDLASSDSGSISPATTSPSGSPSSPSTPFIVDGDTSLEGDSAWSPCSPSPDDTFVGLSTSPADTASPPVTPRLYVPLPTTSATVLLGQLRISPENPSEAGPQQTRITSFFIPSCESPGQDYFAPRDDDPDRIIMPVVVDPFHTPGPVYRHRLLTDFREVNSTASCRSTCVGSCSTCEGLLSPGTPLIMPVDTMADTTSVRPEAITPGVTWFDTAGMASPRYPGDSPASGSRFLSSADSCDTTVAYSPSAVRDSDTSSEASCEHTYRSPDDPVLGPITFSAEPCSPHLIRPTPSLGGLGPPPPEAPPLGALPLIGSLMA